MIIVLFKSGGRESKYPEYVKKFEKNFATYIGVQYGLTFCNGTSAIEAALFGVGIKTGDEVLITSCSVHSTATAVVSVGAQPIFMDINKFNLNLDTNDISKKITQKTKAIVIVHLWGNPVNMDIIKNKAKEYDLKIIEDCSHVHGAEFNGRKLGSFGDIGCFSLQGYKPISAGEGGMLVTNNDEYYSKSLLYGHFGRSTDFIENTKFKEILTTGVGTKRRANPFGILLASIDLNYIESLNKHKRLFIKKIKAKLTKIDGLRMVEIDKGSKQGGFFPDHPFVVEEKYDIDDIINKINKVFKYNIFFRKCYKYHHPVPHIHSLLHLNDLSYRNYILHGNAEYYKGSINKIPVLHNTEKLLNQVIFFPVGYKFSPKKIFFA